ncbi:MAG: hypothetical protein IJF90_06215 [Synergistaceae bacterium]|nr:hypothetical protein [Synergistaceae bacterium]
MNIQAFREEVKPVRSAKEIREEMRRLFFNDHYTREAKISFTSGDRMNRKEDDHTWYIFRFWDKSDAFGRLDAYFSLTIDSVGEYREVKFSSFNDWMDAIESHLMQNQYYWD